MLLAQTKNFIREVVKEAKRLDLPTQKEFKTTFTTIVVMIVVASLGMTLLDLLISFILKIVFGLGR